MTGRQPREGGTDRDWRDRPWTAGLVVLCVEGALYGLIVLLGHLVWGRSWSASSPTLGPMIAAPAYVMWFHWRRRRREEAAARSAVPARVPPPPSPAPPPLP
ncbi:hypothetical protein [Streptomyces sp. NPDC002580]|uniref:hypothetical protein n=1 Tax=Streptomyces sp. NPDC002580 TaxID=3364653 RepID=UPI0036BA4EDD